MEPIRLMVGLGNPGREYENTRHNVGVWFLDQIVERENLQWRQESKFHALLAEWRIGSHTCWLAKPTVFMNHNGRTVRALSQFYKINPSEILIAHDELDFPLGTVRLKEGGGHGGHNGLRDVIQELGTSDFLRLRIGIGHPGHKDLVTPHVLNAPASSEKQIIEGSLEHALQALPYLLKGEMQTAFQKIQPDKNTP